VAAAEVAAAAAGCARAERLLMVLPAGNILFKEPTNTQQHEKYMTVIIHKAFFGVAGRSARESGRNSAFHTEYQPRKINTIKTSRY
jgi:hypothetical protein